MRIQNESGWSIHANAANAPAKTDGLEFGKVLSGCIKSSATADRRSKCFIDLVKDSFADPIPQAVGEVEKICADETGENIDMRTLDDLLNFIISQSEKR